jgi:hypothetical protein
MVKTICTFALVLLCMLDVEAGQSQAPRESEPLKVTLCDLYENPAAYMGKMVRVRGTVSSSDLSIEDFSHTACSRWTNLIVVFPDQVKPKPDFALAQDDSLSAFLDAVRKGKNVEATFYGQFDAIFIWHNQRQVFLLPGGGFERKGFGKKHQYGAEITLQSVSDVVAHEVPFK